MIEVEDLLDSPCSSSTIVEAFGRAERPRACTQKAGCRGSGRVDVRCAPDSGVKADIAGLPRWAKRGRGARLVAAPLPLKADMDQHRLQVSSGKERHCRAAIKKHFQGLNAGSGHRYRAVEIRSASAS